MRLAYPQYELPVVAAIGNVFYAHIIPYPVIKVNIFVSV